jgi:hypothetical protein
MDQASPLSMGGQCLERFNGNVGVGQEDPLATYHFNIFMDDLLERLAMQPSDKEVRLVVRQFL